MAKRRETVEQQPGIQPGEGIEIRMARLESGEWYAQIGAADDENAIAQTSAFPWEALRGLAKQIKEADLSPFRTVGEQECGRCEHASGDSRLCMLLECPIGGAPAILTALKHGSAILGDGVLPVPLDEIVRLHGTLKEPVLRGKGEDEDRYDSAAPFRIACPFLQPQRRCSDRRQSRPGQA